MNSYVNSFISASIIASEYNSAHRASPKGIHGGAWSYNDLFLYFSSLIRIISQTGPSRRTIVRQSPSADGRRSTPLLLAPPPRIGEVAAQPRKHSRMRRLSVAAILIKIQAPPL